MRRWDIFCAVIDNFGDIGVCWRLARQLVAEHQVAVRLWVDRLETFAGLYPAISTEALVRSVEGVEIHRWTAEFPSVDVADVVIEAFACRLPESYVTQMARKAVPPVWINLEYLSAEAWIEECHGLPSPQLESRLKKYFFFPGFTSRTGGLLHERGLAADRRAFDAAAECTFWNSIGIPVRDESELRVSMFCYQNPALSGLLDTWAGGSKPIRLFVTPGAATDQFAQWFGQNAPIGTSSRKGALTVHPIPFLTPTDYDRLLWACDVNFVRGEDSFVRAQWAEKPFVWQIYPQAEDVHLVKLQAFLTRYLTEFPAPEVVRQMWVAWNMAGDVSAAWPAFVEIRQILQQHAQVWSRELDRVGDLADNLVHFARIVAGGSAEVSASQSGGS